MDKPVPDEALMQQYAGGDAGAFETLFKRHKAPLFRFFVRQCGNQAVAEELFQDVWMNLIKARQRYTPDAKFTTYLYRLAHNRLIDFYRSTSSKAAKLFDSEAVPDPDAVADDNIKPLDVSIGTREQVAHLMECVDQLSDEQREAFLMREESEMTLEEIADATHVKRETAKSRLRYAVAALRRCMQRWQ